MDSISNCMDAVMLEQYFSDQRICLNDETKNPGPIWVQYAVAKSSFEFQ